MGLYIQSLEAPDGTQTQDYHGANSEENGTCKTLKHRQTSSIWLFKNQLHPIPRAYQLLQILQCLVPNYSSLCLFSDFLMPDQPGSKG